jgi:hypothetical protein
MSQSPFAKLRARAQHVLASQFVRRVYALLDGTRRSEGEPFPADFRMVPHMRSRRYGWTHYGVMIPDLPAPHHFFSIMSIVGTPGARVFDTDHALKTRPRDNATVVSGTAATHPHHFDGYDVFRDCEMREDGSAVCFGEAVQIRGGYPHYEVRARYAGFELDLSIRNTDRVAWFFKSAVYDHHSLLSEYTGELRWQGNTTRISGLCTFEYAAGPGPYQLREKPLPEALKAPVDFFTYQIINLDPRTQLLLTKFGVLGVTAESRIYLRGLDRPATSHPAEFEVLEDREAISPDGRAMRVPQRFRWIAHDEYGALRLELEGRVDTPFTYGLGSGYVGGYAYAGTLEGEAIEGRGYIEYIDRRDS